METGAHHHGRGDDRRLFPVLPEVPPLSAALRRWVGQPVQGEPGGAHGGMVKTAKEMGEWGEPGGKELVLMERMNGRES